MNQPTFLPRSIHAVLLLLFFFPFQSLFSQDGKSLFRSYEKISPAEKQAYLEKNQLNDALILELDQSVFKKLQKDKGATASFALPFLQPNSIAVELRENNIFSEGFIVTTKSENGENIYPYEKGLHYFGKIKDEGHSMAAFSFFENEVMGVISLNGASYNLERSKELSLDGEDKYILYKESDFTVPYNFDCHTPDGETQEIKLPNGVDLHLEKDPHEKMMVNVNVYIECDYKMYQDNGSDVTATTNFTTGLFNVVAGIYADAGGVGMGPTMLISQTVVWTMQDPYLATTATDSGPVLDAFRCENPTYNGRLAHLLSTSGQNLGGLAARPSCPGSGEYTGPIHGFSNINNSYNVDPANYSWSVNVLAHEMGHNMSSPHTHDCFWNGNSTQIDDCGNVALGSGGGCYNPAAPIIPNWGTIMSYCHLGSSGSMGIDLSQGFHPQVETQINNFSNCLSSTITCGTASLADLSATMITNTSARLNCSLTTGISWYQFGYRVAGSGTGFNNAVGAANFRDIVGLSPNTAYEFYVVFFCTGIGWGGFSCLQTFYTTGPLPNCTSLIDPFNGLPNVDPATDLTWQAATSNPTGYRISIGTTPGGTDIVNNENVGNVTTYDPANDLPSNATIYVRITPYNGNGDASGCDEEVFYTGLPAGLSCLSSPFDANNGAAGNMFDITNQSGSDMEINSFEVHLDPGTWNMEVYYTTSASTFSGNENNAPAWTLLGSASVTSNGFFTPTPLAIGGLTLTPGQSKGIYVTASNGTSINYTNATGTYNDGNLLIDLSAGVGNFYPFGAFFTPRRWNGTICYSLVGSCEANPTVSGNPITAGTYLASNSITGTGTVGAGTTVVFEAPSYIHLDDFAVASTGDFSAIIGAGCTPLTGGGTDKSLTTGGTAKAIQLVQQDTDLNHVTAVVQIEGDADHLHLTLMHPNGTWIDVPNKNTFLAKGTHSLSFDFSGLDLKGPYVLMGQTSTAQEKVLLNF